MSDEYVVTAASIFKYPPILEGNFAVLLGATKDRVATDIGKMIQDPHYAGRAPPCMSDLKSNHLIIKTLVLTQQQYPTSKVCTLAPDWIKIKRILIHPKYQTEPSHGFIPENVYNVALLQLQTRIEEPTLNDDGHFTNIIRPICLPNQKDAPIDRNSIAGTHFNIRSFSRTTTTVKTAEACDDLLYRETGRIVSGYALQKYNIILVG